MLRIYWTSLVLFITLLFFRMSIVASGDTWQPPDSRGSQGIKGGAGPEEIRHWLDSSQYTTDANAHALTAECKLMVKLSLSLIVSLLFSYNKLLAIVVLYLLPGLLGNNMLW